MFDSCHSLEIDRVHRGLQRWPRANTKCTIPLDWVYGNWALLFYDSFDYSLITVTSTSINISCEQGAIEEFVSIARNTLRNLSLDPVLSLC